MNENRTVNYGMLTECKNGILAHHRIGPAGTQTLFCMKGREKPAKKI